jgi:hypothetical protein
MFGKQVFFITILAATAIMHGSEYRRDLVTQNDQITRLQAKLAQAEARSNELEERILATQNNNVAKATVVEASSFWTKLTAFTAFIGACAIAYSLKRTSENIASTHAITDTSAHPTIMLTAAQGNRAKAQEKWQKEQEAARKNREAYAKKKAEERKELDAELRREDRKREGEARLHR